MRKIVPLLVRSEINQEKRHAVRHAIQALAFGFDTGRVSKKRMICVRDVGVADNDIEIFKVAVLETDAFDLPLTRHDLIELGTQMNLAALFLQKLHHRLNERAGTALRKPNAPIPLEVMNQPINR